MRKYLDNTNLVALYYSFFFSHILYGILGWGSATKSAIRPLQTFQNKVLKIINKSTWKPAVSSVAKRRLSEREVWGSILGPVKSAQCRRRLATVAAFLRSCVAQALRGGGGPRNSLHASAYYGEYNEDLI